MAKLKARAPLMIPFDSRGHMLGYSSHRYPDVTTTKVLDYWTWSPTEWREAKEFHAVLQYVGCSRGRSACVFTWKDVMGGESGTQYPMFLSEMNKLLLSCEFQGVGLVDGRWGFAKRGANYSLVAVPLK